MKGTLTIYQPSPEVERGFCARCGTSLTYRRSSRPGLFDITTASLDDPEACPPAKEIWTEERLSWEAANPALPQFAQFSTPRSEDRAYKAKQRLSNSDGPTHRLTVGDSPASVARRNAKT